MQMLSLALLAEKAPTQQKWHGIGVATSGEGELHDKVLFRPTTRRCASRFRIPGR